MILLFDTSTPTGLLALGEKGRVLTSATWLTEKSHSQKLQPQIDSALSQAKVALSQLTHIAVGIGPGSFTGLRVALATAKGLGVALDIPIVAIPSLELFAAGCDATTELIVSTSDAFRAELYVSTYRRVAPGGCSRASGAGGAAGPRASGTPSGDRTRLYVDTESIKSMTPENAIDEIRKCAAPVTLIGTGYARYKSQFDVALSSQLIPPQAEWQFPAMLNLAERYIQEGRLSNPAEIQPYYVRDAEAVEKKRK